MKRTIGTMLLLGLALTAHPALAQVEFDHDAYGQLLENRQKELELQEQWQRMQNDQEDRQRAAHEYNRQLRQDARDREEARLERQWERYGEQLDRTQNEIQRSLSSIFGGGY